MSDAGGSGGGIIPTGLCRGFSNGGDTEGFLGLFRRRRPRHVQWDPMS